MLSARATPPIAGRARYRSSAPSSFWPSGVFYVAQSLILPVILAFLLALVFSPVVRTLSRYRIPQSLTALAIVLTLTTSVIAGIYGLSEPVSKW